jgi:CelD/BcsL family acetyltransferase involved in cellulose biosynthesis
VPATREAWRALAAALPRLRGSVVLIGNPFAAGAETAGGAPPLEPALRRGAETTHLLALPESVEAYWRDVLTTRKRNDIRRLTRKGVTVETSRAPADLAAVYRLYERRRAAWTQRPQLVYPLTLYEQMIAQGGDAARCYVARFEGRIIGGTFVIRWNGIVHYNAGYFDEHARALRPNVLIQERIIRDAIEDRFRLYDMLPSAGLAKVAAFKESFGGRPVALARWERLGRSHRWRLALRRRRTRGGNRDDDD